MSLRMPSTCSSTTGGVPNPIAPRAGDALRNQRVAHHANRPRARHANGAAELAAFAEKLKPCRVSHAAQDVHTGKDRVAPHLAVVRDDDGDSGAHRAFTAHTFPGTADQCCMADRDACDVGDRVVRARRGDWPMMIPRSRARSRGGSSYRETWQILHVLEQERSNAFVIACDERIEEVAVRLCDTDELLPAWASPREDACRNTRASGARSIPRSAWYAADPSAT